MASLTGLCKFYFTSIEQQERTFEGIRLEDERKIGLIIQAQVEQQQTGAHQYNRSLGRVNYFTRRKSVVPLPGSKGKNKSAWSENLD